MEPNGLIDRPTWIAGCYNFRMLTCLKLGKPDLKRVVRDLGLDLAIARSDRMSRHNSWDSGHNESHAIKISYIVVSSGLVPCGIERLACWGSGRTAILCHGHGPMDAAQERCDGGPIANLQQRGVAHQLCRQHRQRLGYGR